MKFEDGMESMLWVLFTAAAIAGDPKGDETRSARAVRCADVALASFRKRDTERAASDRNRSDDG